MRDGDRCKTIGENDRGTTKGREQIVNKTFMKMLDEPGYDVELTYKKKSAK